MAKKKNHVKTVEVGFGKSDRTRVRKISTADVARERRDRMNFQKSTFNLQFDILGATQGEEHTPEQLKLLRAVQSRAEENFMLDGFDGFYSAHQLQTPPIDPIALIETVQKSTALPPLIDSMKVNITRFGWTFDKTIDLTDPSDLEDLKDHVEGDLLHVLETDGVEVIKHMFEQGVPIQKSDEPNLAKRSGFVQAALETVPLLKFADNEENLDLALSSWKQELVEFVDDHSTAFEKLRTRTLRSAVKRVEREQKDEIRYLTSFFDSANPKLSFREIRERNREDQETVGWWTLEVVREPKKRQLIGFEHVPVAQMRATRLGDLVNSWVPQRINKLEIIDRQMPMRYRKFAQCVGHGGNFRWFKEFGDERIMDSKTGNFVGTYVRVGKRWERRFLVDAKDPDVFMLEEDFIKKHPGFEEATEILHHGFYNPLGTFYPVPRWSGCSTLVQGMIAMEEVNGEGFDNNMIPPYFIFVKGGKLSGQSHERVKGALETMRGRENYRRVIVLEADSGKRKGTFVNVGTPTIEVQPMAEVIPTDASHSKYDEKGRTKVRSQFRLTPAHTGQESQYTRQSIGASMMAGEKQVFEPERQADDDVYNKRVLPAMGINYYLYRSNSPPVSDNLESAKVLEILTKSGIIAVGEARPDAEAILNRPLARYGEQELNTTPFPLVLIETKALLGQRSDTSAENPEDKMGARPEKSGMAFESTVIKSLCNKEMGLEFEGDLVSVKTKEAIEGTVVSLFKSSEAVWVRREEFYDLFIRDEAGGIGHVFRKKIA